MSNKVSLQTDKQRENIGNATKLVGMQSAVLTQNVSPKDTVGESIGLSPISDVLAEPEPAAGSKRTFVSTGEKVHKWGTYLSVDWVFNTATGVSFAYWGKYHDLGKKYWSGPITETFTNVLKPFIKDPHQLRKSAGYGNMFMSIIAGGMFTIPPLMMLENTKVKKSVTKFFDGLIYGKEKVGNDPKFQAAYEEIEHAPKKDFSSGLLSRFAALSPLLAMVLIPTTKKISNKVLFNHVERGSEFVATKAGYGAEKLFKNLPAAEAKERWKFIHETVAMDFGLGIPYAIMHAFFYNKFAASKDKSKPEQVELIESRTINSENDAISSVGNDKKWTSAVTNSDKNTQASRTSEGTAGNFADKFAEQSNRGLQIA